MPRFISLLLGVILGLALGVFGLSTANAESLYDPSYHFR